MRSRWTCARSRSGRPATWTGRCLIPLGELAARAGELPRDRPLVIVCRTGARSAYAADALVAAGYDARNLAGGLQQWVAADLPLEPAGGYVL